jgi:hypothetical protein
MHSPRATPSEDVLHSVVQCTMLCTAWCIAWVTTHSLYLFSQEKAVSQAH